MVDEKYVSVERVQPVRLLAVHLALMAVVLDQVRGSTPAVADTNHNQRSSSSVVLEVKGHLPYLLPFFFIGIPCRGPAKIRPR